MYMQRLGNARAFHEWWDFIGGAGLVELMSPRLVATTGAVLH